MTVDLQLEALKEFSSSEKKDLNESLESIISDIAATGQYVHPWQMLKPVFAYKLEKITENFLMQNPPLTAEGTTDEEECNKLIVFRKNLIQSFENFALAPFTMQRIAELLLNPSKYYRSTPKFFRGLEKNIMVVSTINPISPEQKSLKRTLEAKQPDDVSSNDITAPPEKKLSCENSVVTTPNTSEVENDGIVDDAELRCNESVDDDVMKVKSNDTLDVSPMSSDDSLNVSPMSSEGNNHNHVNQSAHVTSSSSVQSNLLPESSAAVTSSEDISTTSDSSDMNVDSSSTNTELSGTSSTLEQEKLKESNDVSSANSDSDITISNVLSKSDSDGEPVSDTTNESTDNQEPMEFLENDMSTK